MLRRHLRSSPETRLARGIYSAAGLLESDRSVALLQTLTSQGPHIVSHESAAVIWGILDEELTPPFHLTAPPEGSRIRRPGLVDAHRSEIPEDFIVESDGLQIVHPAWAWLDLALGSTEERALVLADQVLSTRITRPGRPSPLALKDELETAITARGRARGIRTARSALALSSDAADSPPETRLRYYCCLGGLPEPSVNPLIGDRAGERLFRPDLAFFEFRVAVQYEGALFHSDPERVLKDVRRQEITEALGWVEVRITKDHMRNGGAAAIRKIRAQLMKHGWSPAS